MSGVTGPSHREVGERPIAARALRFQEREKFNFDSRCSK